MSMPDPTPYTPTEADFDAFGNALAFHFPFIMMSLTCLLFRLPRQERIFLLGNAAFFFILKNNEHTHQFKSSLLYAGLILGLLGIFVSLVPQKKTRLEEVGYGLNLGLSFFLFQSFSPLRPWAFFLFPLSMSAAFPTVRLWPWLPAFFFLIVGATPVPSVYKGMIFLAFFFAWIQALKTDKIHFKTLLWNLGLFMPKLVYDCLASYWPLPEPGIKVWGILAIVYGLIYGFWRHKNHVNAPWPKGWRGVIFTLLVCYLVFMLVLYFCFGETQDNKIINPS